MPSAVNSAENVGDFFFSVGRTARVYPTVQKPLLKSLKRLLPICDETDKEKKKGDWYVFFFFLEWLRVFLKKWPRMGTIVADWDEVLTPARWLSRRIVGNEAAVRCLLRPSRPRRLKDTHTHRRCRRQMAHVLRSLPSRGTI